MPSLYNLNPQITHRNLMVFIDGENLVCRFQKLKEEKEPKDEVIHKKDIYVWTPILGFPDSGHEIIRAYYYISALGDESKLSSIKKEIKELTLLPRGGNTPKLYPVIFKKENKNSKAKGVDIQMAVDTLTHVYQNNIDTVWLFTGDGDYQSLMEEVIRRGKKVYVAAFSSGFNPKLESLADGVLILDEIFFKTTSS